VKHDYKAVSAPCANEIGSAKASDTCTTFLGKNTKARIEWRLEQRLRQFEASWK